METETTAASLTVFYRSPPSAVRRLTSTKRETKQPLEAEIEANVLKTEAEDNESFDDIGDSFISPCDRDEAEETKVKFDTDEIEYVSPLESTTHVAVGKKASKKKTVKERGLSGSDEAELLSDWPGKDNKLDVFNFSCQYCSSMYINEDDILNHVKEKHSEVDLIQSDPLLPSLEKKEKRKHSKIDQETVNEAKVVVEGRVYYNCKICGKSLYSPYTYIWHMRIHTGERPYVCDLCGKQFRVSQGLVRHLRETHEGIKNFPCDICGRMFATRRNVEEHRRIHTNERPYICDLCGKSFKQKASLFVHNRSHTDFFPFRCSYCNQGFRTRPPLLIHVTRHTGEKPYPCDVCGRCFRIKYELKRHRLIHSDEKPFSCSDCGLSFRQKRYLRNHNKTNHNRATP